jgi:ribosomal protein S18 acetylase RimI-like enzyme
MAEVRLLIEEDAPAFWNLRLEALEREPRSFAESPEEHRQTPVSSVAHRLRNGGPNNFVVGAFERGSLIGTAGFLRGDRIKTRHQGRVWGVYVTGTARNQGIGRKMFDVLLSTARGLNGLTTIALTVAEDNRPAVELYRSLGFAVYGNDPCGLRVEGVCVAELLMRYEIGTARP